jgi:hypothetical protein
MARSKSPARTSRAKPAAAASGSIKWGDFEVTPLTKPLAIFSIFHIIYAVEMMGFQITGTDMMPSFKAAPACVKYLKNPEGCADKPVLTSMYIFFGINLLFMQVFNLCTAFRKNLDFQVTLARTRMIQTQCVCTLLVAGNQILNSTQFKFGIFLQTVLAFYLQHSLRNQGSGVAPGDRDYEKHGQAGYLQLFFFACNFFYWVNATCVGGLDEYAIEGYVRDEQTQHIWAWWAMSCLFSAADMLIGFEYLSTEEIKENFQYYILPMAIGLLQITYGVSGAGFKPEKVQEITMVYTVFIGLLSYFSFGEKLLKKEE